VTAEGRRYSNRKAWDCRSGSFNEVNIPVVDETPVTIYLNGREIITFLASDDALEYLAAGFLKSEGLVDRREDIVGISVGASRQSVEIEASSSDILAEKLLEKRTVTSGCGKGTTFYHATDALQVRPVAPGPTVQAGLIRRLMRELHHHSVLYRIAGGIHSAALCDEGGIVIFRDDIGRHNAVDKIHGQCFLDQIPVDDKLLLTTGRISSEILIKAAKLGVPILVSRSSPTGLALDFAERAGITVVGLVRGGRLVVYSHPERVVRQE
jgi:FdhD protein